MLNALIRNCWGSCCSSI